MAAWMKVFMSMWAVTSQCSGGVNGRRELYETQEGQLSTRIEQANSTYSRAWSACRHFVTFSRTFSHLTCPSPGTDSCTLAESSRQ